MTDTTVAAKTVTDEMVADVVDRYIADVRLEDGAISMAVDRPHIQRGDGWWRVPVRMTRFPERMLEYYTVMAEIESEIAEKEGLNVLLVTGKPLSE